MRTRNGILDTSRLQKTYGFNEDFDNRYKETVDRRFNITLGKRLTGDSRSTGNVKTAHRSIMSCISEATT